MNEDLLSQADLFTLANIVLIDLVLAGDNAIVVGMAASKVAPSIRPRLIALGVGSAVMIRLFLAGISTYLLTVFGLTLAGGLLLLWVCWRMYREFSIAQPAETTPLPVDSSRSRAGFRSALVRIILADVSMSLDNVLAVAGASNGNLVLLTIGLGLAVLGMAVAASCIADLLERFPWIMWAGLLVILYVALDMIARGGFEIACSAWVNFDCLGDPAKFVH